MDICLSGFCWGIYTVKYPLEAPSLMKYGEVVRDLAARGGDWHFYDQQFRHLHQSNTSEMSWGCTHWELWICAQNFHNSARFTQNLTVRNSSAPYAIGPFVPKGYCHKFHRGNNCPGCSFRHQCFKCGVVHPANRCNFRSSSLTLVCNRSLQNRELPTPIQTDKLKPLLDGYDVGLTSILCNGFRFGFSLHFEGSRKSFLPIVYFLREKNPEIVDAKLSKELAANRLAGPFDALPFANFRVSPLGVVPKKTSGEYRLIHHLSYPNGDSVNYGISSDYSTVNYARVDDAIAMIKLLGRGCFLAKSAFRIIPIRPSDYDLLGI